MLSASLIKQGVLDAPGGLQRVTVKRLNRQARRQAMKMHAHKDDTLMARRERRMQAHPKEEW